MAVHGPKTDSQLLPRTVSPTNTSHAPTRKSNTKNTIDTILIDYTPKVR